MSEKLRRYGPPEPFDYEKHSSPVPDMGNPREVGSAIVGFWAGTCFGLLVATVVVALL